MEGGRPRGREVQRRSSAGGEDSKAAHVCLIGQAMLWYCQ